MERGLAFRAADLLAQLRALDAERPPHTVDLESMLRETPQCDLQRPRLVKVSTDGIRWLQVSPDGALFIFPEADGLTSYVAATGERCSKITNEYKFLRLSGENALLQKDERVFTWNLRDEPVILDDFRIKIPKGECFAVSSSGRRCFVFDMPCYEWWTATATKRFGKRSWTEI